MLNTRARGNCQTESPKPRIKPRDRTIKEKTTVFTRPKPVRNQTFDLFRPADSIVTADFIVKDYSDKNKKSRLFFLIQFLGVYLSIKFVDCQKMVDSVVKAGICLPCCMGCCC